jgi:alcohol dehydrogenase
MTLPDYFEFMCPVKTGSGYRALEHLPMDLAALDAKRPLIVTEKKHTAGGKVKHIANAFKASGVKLGAYDGVTEMSGIETVRELYGLYRDKGFDAIIALGHGNVVDIAKILNIAVSGRPEDLKELTGINQLKEPLKPLVFVPVSIGTGRETSCEAQVKDYVYSSKFLMPNLVVVDPRMLDEEEPERLVNTAMASMAYAAEAYASPDNNPFTKMYAQLAVDFVINNLLVSIGESQDKKGKIRALIQELTKPNPRISLANAACMAGYVYSNTPEGLASRISRAVSKVCDEGEGVLMGILLPYVLEYHVFRKGADLSGLLLPMAGLDLFCSTPKMQRFNTAVGMIRRLQNDIYTVTSSLIPRTLEDTKLSRSRLSEIAHSVANDGSGDVDSSDCLMILEHAFDGKPVTP